MTAAVLTENILPCIVSKHANKCVELDDGSVHVVHPSLLFVCCSRKPYRMLTMQQLEKIKVILVKLVVMRKASSPLLI